MTNRSFKLSILVLFGALFLAHGLEAKRVAAFSGGPPNGVTGAPGEPTCAVSGCHSTNGVNTGSGTLSLAGLPANYAPNQEIDLTVTLAQSNRVLYGFSLTALNASGDPVGELIVTEVTRTQRSTENITGAIREYISHTFEGITPNAQNQNSWRLRWKAPAQSAGQVTFYVAGNAANGNGTTGGDFIYTTSAVTRPQTFLASMSNVSAASFTNNAAIAPDSIAAAFSVNMSGTTVAATTVPLPTELGGTQIRVRDALSVDRNAPLFFVSPGQVNYLVPAGTAAGRATVTARRNSVDVSQGTVQIEAVAPGVFSANASGQGVAAAVVFRRKANGQETFEPVAQINSATNRFDVLPIDLGPDLGGDSDQVFLILFGTAFRGRGALAATSATIGGAASEVSFAGPQGSLAGLDQANLRIPRSLAGRGNVDVVFKADNKTANTVTINVK